jgi:hypothetical protein
MATKTFYATKDIKNPSLYGTRMLKAGDPVELDGPKSRLYLALGAVSPVKPRVARSAPETVEAPVVVAETSVPKPTRKRTTRRKK